MDPHKDHAWCWTAVPKTLDLFESPIFYRLHLDTRKLLPPVKKYVFLVFVSPLFGPSQASLSGLNCYVLEVQVRHR